MMFFEIDIIFLSVQVFLLGILSVQDWRTKRISIFWLFLFVVMTFWGLRVSHFPINFEMVVLIVGLLLFIKVLALLGLGKNIIGNGDLVLLLPLLMSIHLEELPVFLMSAGVGGSLTSRLLKERAVPFVPSLSVAYAIALGVRGFLS